MVWSYYYRRVTKTVEIFGWALSICNNFQQKFPLFWYYCCTNTTGTITVNRFCYYVTTVFWAQNFALRGILWYDGLRKFEYFILKEFQTAFPDRYSAMYRGHMYLNAVSMTE
jgi:hypothetical protein